MKLFVKKNEEVIEDEVTQTKDEFIKSAAMVHRESSLTLVVEKPVSRLEKLMADLEAIETEMAQMWAESGKTPKTAIESFSKLPNVDKKLEIMFEDSRSTCSSKSKFISSMIEEKYEQWKKYKEL